MKPVRLVWSLWSQLINKMTANCKHMAVISVSQFDHLLHRLWMNRKWLVSFDFAVKLRWQKEKRWWIEIRYDQSCRNKARIFKMWSLCSMQRHSFWVGIICKDIQKNFRHLDKQRETVCGQSLFLEKIVKCWVLEISGRDRCRWLESMFTQDHF